MSTSKLLQSDIEGFQSLSIAEKPWQYSWNISWYSLLFLRWGTLALQGEIKRFYGKRWNWRCRDGRQFLWHFEKRCNRRTKWEGRISLGQESVESATMILRLVLRRLHRLGREVRWKTGCFLKRWRVFEPGSRLYSPRWFFQIPFLWLPWLCIK